MDFWNSAFLWPGTTDKAQLLAQYAHYRCTTRARQLVQDVGRDQRRDLCRSLTGGGSTMLNIAAGYGDREFVDFLLDECSADVDQRGAFSAGSSCPGCKKNNQEVTPLWTAAAVDSLRVVQTLVAHGANMAAVSEDQRSPVYIASQLGHLDIVRYLVDKGADVHRPDLTGTTCLMNGALDGDLQLCQLLLDRGAAASINTADNAGNTALHFAIQNADIDILRLLVRHGADPTVRNHLGEDALMAGALYAYGTLERPVPELLGEVMGDHVYNSDSDEDLDVDDFDLDDYDEPPATRQVVNQPLRNSDAFLDLLISELKPSAQRLADVYALIGASHLDETTNMEEAMRFWRLSIIVRRYQGVDDDAVPHSLPQSIYDINDHVEAMDIQSLTAIADDEDKMYMQAMVVRERILGPGHSDTIYWLMHRAVWYAERQSYQRGLDLLKHALSLCAASCPVSLVNIGLFGLKSFCQTFWKRYNDDRSAVEFTDVADVLRSSVGASSKPPTLGVAEDQFVVPSEDRALIRIYIHLVELLTRLAASDDDLNTLAQLARSLVRSNPTTADGRTLLHHAVDPACSAIDDMFYSYRVADMPSLAVVDALVAAGTDVHARDHDGSTALQVATNSRSLWLKLFPTRASRRVSAIMELLTRASLHPPSTDPMDDRKPDVMNSSADLPPGNITAQNIYNVIMPAEISQVQSLPGQSSTTGTGVSEPMDERTQPIVNQSIELPHEVNTTHIVPADVIGHATVSDVSQSPVEAAIGIAGLAMPEASIAEADTAGADFAEAAITEAQITEPGQSELPM